MDDLFDDDDELLDPSNPLGVVPLASGLLDDDVVDCACWCMCDRKARLPEEICTPCLNEDHRDEDLDDVG